MYNIEYEASFNNNVEQITNTLPQVTAVPYEVGTNTAVVEPPKPVNPQVYANALVVAGMMGVTLSDAQKAELMNMNDQGSMNKFIMAVKSTPAANIDKLYPEEEASLLRIAQNNRAPRYRTLKQELDNFQAQINRWNADIDSYINRSLAHRAEMQYYESLPGIDLITPLKQLLRSGTVKVNAITDAEIILTTRPIFCKHVDKTIGVNMIVPMGTYKIQIKTSDFRVYVMKNGDNITSNGYWHPHVDSLGSPCWGNINTQVTKYRSEAKLYELVTATVQLLEAYNPDSPYRKLFFFDKERNPDKYGNLDVQYVPAGDYHDGNYVAMYDKHFNSYIQEAEDSDERTVYVFEAFVKVYKAMPDERVDNSIYIKTDSGWYHRINGMDYYWCDEDGEMV